MEEIKQIWVPMLLVTMVIQALDDLSESALGLEPNIWSVFSLFFAYHHLTKRQNHTP